MQTEDELVKSKIKLNRNIFRAYDIRGIADVDLTAENVYLIGRAIGSYAMTLGEKSIAVARDGRLSGLTLLHALCDGLQAAGCHVIDIGMVPTPLLYYATTMLDTRSGVMLTGSHNPAEYNGLKIVLNGMALTTEEIFSLYERIEANDFIKGAGEHYEIDILQRYISEIKNTVFLPKKLKIVVDCGNGIPGFVAPQLYRELGCEVIELFCEVDGRFPHHHPDPSQPENLRHLIEKMKATNADVGIALDGDGDRLGIVTKAGKIIWPDRQLMFFARDILAKHPGAKVVYDVKCTHHLAALIAECGGEPIMWKTGHSLIKAKLAETKAILGGEMSGHLFFKDKWHGFDDGIYAGARLLEILANSSEDVDALFASIPDSVNTPEMKIFVEDHEKFSLMERIMTNASFVTAQTINTIDGLRVNFAEGWGLVRPSNTSPYLVLRFEAQDQNALLKIQMLFKNFLLAIEPQLQIPF